MNFERSIQMRENRNPKSRMEEHPGNFSVMLDDFISWDFRQPSFSTTGVSTPAVNIIETNDDFRLEMVAPGMKKEDFKIELQDGVLAISYDHDDNREGERRNWKYSTREYNYHSFSRSFSLPETVDSGQIHAGYEAGILTLVLPKKDGAKGELVRQIKVL